MDDKTYHSPADTVVFSSISICRILQRWRGLDADLESDHLVDTFPIRTYPNDYSNHKKEMTSLSE